MGFRDLIAFDKAMLGKQAWRLAQNQNSLWSRVLKGLYHPNKSFLHVERGPRPSWGWQSILYDRETISGSVRWSIGNGENISIREDHWLSRGTIGGPANKNEPSKVAELISNQNAKWDEPILRQIFDEKLVIEILSTPLNLSFGKDKLIWTGRQSGLYTVKTGYNVIRDKTSLPSTDQASTSFQPSRGLWNRIWKAHIPPKIRFFLWSLCQDALPTKVNLCKRDIITQPLCSLCNQQIETTEHIFLHCLWIETIWLDPLVLGQSQKSQGMRMDQWLQNLMES